MNIMCLKFFTSLVASLNDLITGEVDSSISCDSFADKKECLTVHLEHLNAIEDSCQRNLSNIKEITNEGWFDIGQKLLKESHTLLDTCKGKRSQIMSKLETEQILHEKIEGLEKELEIINGEAEQICEVQRDFEDINELLENVKEGVVNLDAIEMRLKESVNEIQNIKEDIPTLEAQKIMDKIDFVEKSISLKKSQMLMLQQCSEEILVRMEDAERIEKTATLIQLKVNECSELPINERGDTIELLLNEAKECLGTMDDMWKELKSDWANLKAGRKLQSKLHAMRQCGKDTYDNIMLMKSESMRFSKSYKELLSDVNDIEVKVLVCRSESEEMDSVKDALDTLNRRRDLLCKLEEEIGEMNGRLKIVGDALSGSELKDCGDKIIEIRETCKTEKNRLDLKIVEMKEAIQVFNVFDDSLAEFLEQISNIQSMETDGVELAEAEKSKGILTAMTELEKVETSFDSQIATIDSYLDHFSLKEKENIKLQKEHMRDMISQCRRTLDYNAKLLETKQSIASGLKESEITIENISRIIENVHQSLSLNEVEGLFEIAEAEMLVCKNRVAEISGKFSDLKSTWEGQNLSATGGEIDGLLESITSIEEKIARVKLAFNEDLVRLKELERAADSKEVIKLSMKEIEGIEHPDGDLNSCIANIMGMVDKAESAHEHVRSVATNIDEIAFASMRNEAAKILKPIEESEKEWQQSIETLNRKIESMKEVQSNLIGLNGELDVLDQRIAGHLIPSKTSESVEGLREHQEKCHLLLKMNDTLKRELLDLDIRKEKIKSNMSSMETEGVETRVDDMKCRIDEIGRKLGVEVRDCQFQLDFMENLDDIKMELAHFVTIKDIKDLNQSEAVLELSVLLNSIRGIKDCNDKLCALERAFASEDLWGEEVAKKINLEFSHIRKEIGLKETEGKVLIEKMDRLIKEQVDEMDAKVGASELGSEEKEIGENIAEIQKSISNISILLEQHSNLRQLAVIMKENAPKDIELNCIVKSLDSLKERMDAMLNQNTGLLEKLQEARTATQNYEDDISNLAQQLAAVRDGENQYETKTSLAGLRSVVEEDEFMLNKIDEAFASILEDEEDLAMIVSKGKMAELLEIKSEFLEDFNYLKGKVKSDYERIERMEKDFSMALINIDCLINRIESIKSEMTRKNFDHEDQQKLFFQEKLQCLNLLEEDLNSVESEYKVACSFLPENEKLRLHDQFYLMCASFEEALATANNELELATGIRKVMEELDELENIEKGGETEKNIEELIKCEEWIFERLNSCEEELDKLCRKDGGKEKENDVVAPITMQLESAGKRIENMKVSSGNRQKTLKGLKEERENLGEYIDSKEFEIESFNKRLMELKAKPKFGERFCEELKILEDQLEGMETKLKNCTLQEYKPGISMKEDVDISMKRTMLLNKVSHARNEVAELLRSSNEYEEKISSSVNTAEHCCTLIRNRIDELMQMEIASFEKGKENVVSFKNYLNGISEEYEMLKKDAKLIEDNADECKDFDKSLFQLEKAIIDGEDAVRKKNEKLMRLEKSYNAWNEKRLMAKEKISTNEINFSHYLNLEDARLAVMNELQSLGETDSLINGLNEDLELIVNELPLVVKSDAMNDLDEIRMQMLNHRNELSGKVKMIDGIKIEVREIEKHLSVNLKWILIAKKAVKKEDKAAQCMEELLKERDNLVDQIDGLNGDVDFVLEVGKSLCENLPIEEKSTLERLLEKVITEWNSVKDELFEKKERLDESIVERDAFITAIASCLMRIQEVENKCRSFEELNEENKAEIVMNIKEELQSVAKDDEILAQNSKQILKKLVDDEKESILVDLDNIKLKMNDLLNWLTKNEGEIKSHIETVEKIHDNLHLIKGKVDHTLEIMDDLEKCDDVELAKQNLLKAEHYFETVSKDLVEIMQEVENKQLVNVAGEVAKIELNLKSTEDRLNIYKRRSKEMMENTNSICRKLEECSLRTTFLVRCLEFGNIAGAQKSLEDIEIGLDEIKNDLDVNELFGKESISKDIERVEERLRDAMDSLNNILKKIKIDAESKMVDFSAILERLEERLEHARVKVDEEIPKEQTATGKLQCLETVLELLSILKKDTASMLPSILLFISDKDGNEMLQLDKRCLQLQENIYELKATAEMRAEALRGVIFKVTNLNSSIKEIKVELDDINNCLETSVQKTNFKQLKEHLETLHERCHGVEDVCFNVMSLVRSLPEYIDEQEGEEKQGLLRECKEVHGQLNAVSSLLRKEVECIEKAKQLTEMSKETEDIAELKENFTQFVNEMQNCVDEKEIKSFMQKLRERLKAKNQMKYDLSNMGRSKIQLSNECHSEIIESMEKLDLSANEIEDEINQLEELRIRVSIDHMKHKDAATFDEKIIAFDDSKQGKLSVDYKEKEDLETVNEPVCEEVMLEDDFGAFTDGEMVRSCNRMETEGLENANNFEGSLAYETLFENDNNLKRTSQTIQDQVIKGSEETPNSELQFISGHGNGIGSVEEAVAGITSNAAPPQRHPDQGIHIIDVGDVFSPSVSSLKTGFEDEEEIFRLMRETSNELCNIDQLITSSSDQNVESLESLLKSLASFKVNFFYYQSLK